MAKKNFPDALPADSGTAKAIADAGVKPGDVIETDSGEKIRIGNTTPPDVFTLPHSKVQASCGRVVHVYSNQWVGPRPAIVVQAWGVSGTHQLINATVIQDGCNDKALPQGGTLGSVGLYDPLTSEQRAALVAGPGASSANNPPRFHAEWMPFQAGQATQTKNLASAANAAIRKIAAHYGTDFESEIDAILGD